MRRHRTLLFAAGPVLLLTCAALAVQSTAPAKPVPDADAAPAPEAPKPTVAPENSKVLAVAADMGRFLSIPDGALDTLTQRLQKKDGKPLVVVQYGDSHTQAAVLPRELRNALAAGRPTSPGFVAPGLHNLGDATCSLVGRWNAQNWLRAGDSGSFGPLGTAQVTRDLRARVHLHLKQTTPAGSTVTAFYKRDPRHLPFQLVANGTVLKTVSPSPLADGDKRMLASVQVTLPAGATDVELAIAPSRRAGPELRFFGFLVQYPGAAVELDAFGVQGTAVDHPLNRGDTTLEEYLAQRQPDLLVVWYGSNTLVAPNYEPVSYGKTFGSFLARLKAAAPQAARLAIGPPDLARRPSACPTWSGSSSGTKYVRVGRHRRIRTVKHRMSEAEKARWTRFICEPENSVVEYPGHPAQYPVKGIRTAAQWLDYLQSCQIQTLPAVATITESERQASQREGFAFFDTYAFMDGAGSIHRWACQQPQLARFDHVHLTPEGYATVAQGLWAALQGPLKATALPGVKLDDATPVALPDDPPTADPDDGEKQ